MKAFTFLSVFILIVHISYAQEPKSDFQSSIVHIEENHYKIGNNALQPVFEIKFEEIVKSNNNSEGKFPSYRINKDFKVDFNKESEFAIPKEDKIASESQSFISQEQRKFIQDLITRRINEADFKTAFVREFQIKENIENRFSNDIPVFKDVLNSIYQITSEIEIQIGKNLHNYLRKINKTEIDKTLNNSLNLLAISF